MIDTHTHLYLEEFPDGGVSAVEEAMSAGVNRFIFPNVDVSTLEPMLELHHKYPENSRIAIGLHPTEVNAEWRDEMKKIEPYLDLEGVAAIGEVGIDLYRDRTFGKEQAEALDYQLGLASERNIPVIIHCRDGLDLTLEVFRRFNGRLPEVVFHSFTMGTEEVRKIREVSDPMFGINGVVTFKNAAPLREALPEIGIERIMLETDSPYLAPVPNRGKRNTSAYLPYIKDMIASTLRLTGEEVERQTDSNAARFFRLAP